MATENEIIWQPPKSSNTTADELQTTDKNYITPPHTQENTVTQKSTTTPNITIPCG
jgi:hypothetical protein